ncbi:hypothetical protein [Acanthamoeba polyphaga mimivirus]|uniref:Uncharacterized protein n=5 Tax=Megamimivirinae TaxID=3044648 RepID=A0A2L2DMD9_MIMIV|nr:hypothetical protein MegaChil _gp0492 [Megavirus chiliensis]AEX61635.1 hypothetical protein c7_L572 [Megavirus courdo7]AFX92547.1 hypothetical protein CE11_00520 [Megavirus courdo11]AGD92410.1 hypothetical protein LBA_00492 [Megavirus lba]AVG46223.1 hypothetical protein [Acanthamoeba polyphaga mimivirus]AVL93818.1 hypothetical protein mvi_458 [Megavirus vitis]
MLQAVFMGLLTATSAIIGCELYRDYEKRNLFSDWIESGKPINGKNILQGNIDNSHDLTDNLDPFISRQIVTRESIYFYDKEYYTFYNTRGVKYQTPLTRKTKYYYWNHSIPMIYWSQFSKLNGYNLVVNNLSKINYSHEYKININKKNYTLIRYIPDNTNTTVFGEINNTNNSCTVEFIGSRSSVLQNISEKYFNIYDEYTISLVLGLATCFYFSFNLKL